jgi:hypothetical protein
VGSLFRRIAGLRIHRPITVDAKSNDDGAREGAGAFRLRRRPIGGINTGFINIP